MLAGLSLMLRRRWVVWCWSSQHRFVWKTAVLQWINHLFNSDNRGHNITNNSTPKENKIKRNWM